MSAKFVSAEIQRADLHARVVRLVISTAEEENQVSDDGGDAGEHHGPDHGAL